MALLARHFLGQYREKYHKENLEIGPGAMKELSSYHWPGNVRELQHGIERAVILSDGDEIQASHLSFSAAQKKLSTDSFQTLEDMEKQMIVATLEKEGGKMSAVAGRLGISRQTLYNKLKKYGIDP